MANKTFEMTMTTINTEVSTTSTLLDKALARIKDAFKKGNESQFEIARALYEIKFCELYKVTGAESFSEYAEGTLKISKSKASRLVAVAEKFLIKHDNTEVKQIGVDEIDNARHDYDGYTISQLTEMLGATDEMLKYINTDMNSKEIRDYVSNAKKMLNGDTPNPDGQDDNTPNPDGQNDNTPNPDGQNDNTPNPDGQDDNTPNPDEQNDNTPNPDEQNDTPDDDPNCIDNTKTLQGTGYKVYFNANNEPIGANCDSPRGLKNFAAWCEKNRHYDIKLFTIAFSANPANTDI